MFTSLRKLNRWLLILLLGLTLSSVVPTSALARSPKGINDKLLEVDTSKSYAVPYMLVVLGVTLGVLIVARPSTRGDEAKRPVDEDEL